MKVDPEPPGNSTDIANLTSYLRRIADRTGLRSKMPPSEAQSWASRNRGRAIAARRGGENSVDVFFGSDGKSMGCVSVGSVGFFGKRCSGALLEPRAPDRDPWPKWAKAICG